ncbi:class I SAM-dependent methyltransferase [Variovorax sp. J31P179]|uniref:class I SAM-dependent methyltransferase n=1 Tax=Variovorax sp. J31P179 TaxID=3053508 RepID=UPI0025761B7E|nr:class I SAM-dependent methyltransferase [Variovorax sp. J31P179]MDM0081332.1 class I SAM-dependent methyltransferase [Variovorax sp. J31P179]
MAPVFMQGAWTIAGHFAHSVLHRVKSERMTSVHSCRLCGGPLSKVFNTRLLKKHDVAFFKCDSCDSLQSEEPYWLDAAYAVSLSRLDTGAGQRNMISLAGALSVAKLFGARNLIDMGGGDGLLCRLLRDYGLNCYVTDKFAAPTYAQGFTEPNFAKPEMIVAFEVIEHFAQPASELAAIFDAGANVIMLTTEVYDGQSEDWWYLAPETGQHIFFYSHKAMHLIGERYGYDFVKIGRFALFTKGKVKLQCFAASLLLRGPSLALVRALVQLMPAPGVAKDVDFQRSK